MSKIECEFGFHNNDIDYPSNSELNKLTISFRGKKKCHNTDTPTQGDPLDPPTFLRRLLLYLAGLLVGFTNHDMTTFLYFLCKHLEADYRAFGHFLFVKRSTSFVSCVDV